MIDAKTGQLLIDKERFITTQTSLATIEKWKLGTSQEIRQMGNTWRSVEVKNLKIDALYLNISFLFKDKKIAGFTFVFQEKPYEMHPSWDSWSKGKEQVNLVRFKNWLEEQFGELRSFEWGSVEAVYDPKSAGSSIKVHYI